MGRNTWQSDSVRHIAVFVSSFDTAWQSINLLLSMKIHLACK